MPKDHQHKKRFGQHFLHDEHILSRIVQCIRPQQSDHVIEIGPGQGALTQHLVDQVKRLDLIEIDRDLINPLQQQFSQDHLHIHCADILQFDLQQLTSQQQRLRIIGNLPYNISTPILFKLFEHLDDIEDMTFLLQHEVVARMTATANQKQYGRLSVMTQYYCQAVDQLAVPASAFTPPPKVESNIVKLIPHRQRTTIANDIEQLSMIVRDAFNQRRKTVSNSLKKWIDATSLTRLNINPKKRPQELTVDDYVSISNSIKKA